MEKENPIKAYIHCKTCMSGRLAIGWTEKGFAVWCEDCDKEVANFDLKGNKLGVIK